MSKAAVVLGWMKRYANIADRNGLMCVLTGPPQTGKGYFAKWLAEEIGATYFKISCSSSMTADNLRFNIDIDEGNQLKYTYSEVVKAFENSQVGKVVLLIDELDKTKAGFEDLFLSIFEDFEIKMPLGKVIKGNSKNLTVIIANNNRRDFREETLRRFPIRKTLGYPSREEQMGIISPFAPKASSKSLQLLCGIAEEYRKMDVFKAPSYGELAAVYNAAREFIILDNQTSVSDIRDDLKGSLWKDPYDMPDIKFDWAKAIKTAIKRDLSLIAVSIPSLQL